MVQLERGLFRQGQPGQFERFRTLIGGFDGADDPRGLETVHRRVFPKLDGPEHPDPLEQHAVVVTVGSGAFGLGRQARRPRGRGADFAPCAAWRAPPIHADVVQAEPDFAARTAQPQAVVQWLVPTELQRATRPALRVVQLDTAIGFDTIA